MLARLSSRHRKVKARWPDPLDCGFERPSVASLEMTWRTHQQYGSRSPMSCSKLPRAVLPVTITSCDGGQPFAFLGGIYASDLSLYDTFCQGPPPIAKPSDKSSVLARYLRPACSASPWKIGCDFITFGLNLCYLPADSSMIIHWGILTPRCKLPTCQWISSETTNGLWRPGLRAMP